jgi:predicted transcriptional regulator
VTGGQVRAGLRLGHPDRSDVLAGHEARQPTPALLGGRQAQEIGRDHVRVDTERRGVRDAGAGELFAQHRVEAEVLDAAAPAVLRDTQAEEAVAPGREPDVAIDRPLGAMALARRQDRALHEVPYRFAEPEVLVLE